MRQKFLIAALLLTTATGAFAADAAAPAADTAAANDPRATSDEIVVTAPRLQQDARSKQKNALVIVDVQSIETIKKYPDFNAAEALGRIPGLSLSSDTGEGRFVNIRGIDANLNGATYGGVVLLNTFAAGTAASGSGRAVEFDTIPTGAIDGIVVYKTLSPDREAEGLGGQIELTPRTARNITKTFIEGELGVGYEPLHTHGGPYSASLAVGAKLGDFSFVLNGSRKDDRRAIDDNEPSYANDGTTSGNPATDLTLGRTDFRRYDYSRRRFGYGGELDFAPSDDHRYYARLDIAGYVERQLKDHFYANFDGAPSPVDAGGFVVDGFQPQIDIVNAQETHRNTIAAVGGEDHFGDLKIDYRAAYSRATFVQNYYNEARFFGSDSYFGRYNNIANPERFTYQLFKDAALTVPFIASDATQYGGPNNRAASLSAFAENDVDQEYSGAANARYAVSLFGGDGEFKAGFGIRRRDKTVNDFGGRATSTIALSSIEASVGPSQSYRFGQDKTAPVANYPAIQTLVRGAIPTLTPSIGRDFKDQENVTAGYLMYSGQYGKLGVLTGVRIEATDATYGNFLTTTDASGNSTTSFVNNKKSYTDFFPTVQVKYAFEPNLLLRATYSTGIARPGFSQAGGSAGVDFTTAPRPVFSAGNPNLKPTTGNNFDLDLEYYLPGGGIVQVGVFDKEFKNYIFRNALININDPIFLGQNGDFVTYSNENAYARGIEIAYQQKFTFLPGLLGGLGAEGNLTLVKSKFLEYSAAVRQANGAGATDQFGSLPGTSGTTWNLAGFYERGPVNVRLAAQFVGSSLFSLNGDQTVDTIQSSRLSLDLTASYEVVKDYVLFFGVRNLLNTPLRYVDGRNARTQQIEFYGQTYEGGIRFKF